jgi:hypothetical protein
VLISRFDPDLELERLELRRSQRKAALTRLGRVVAARAKLDARERELVVVAREAGASWEEIGRALGVSRSQAHRRHAAGDPRRKRRAADPWPPPTPLEIAAEIERLRAEATARRARRKRRRR